MEDWEIEFREKLDKKLTEFSYIIPYGNNVMAIVSKKHKIDYEVLNLKLEINKKRNNNENKK